MTRPTAKRNQVSTSSLFTWWHGFDESAPKFELRPALLAIKMMTPNQSYSTKLPTPNQLPEQGLTAQQFKSWHIQLNIFLQQFPRNIVFLPAPPAAAAPNRLQEGIYHTWRPSSQHGIYGRIDQLHDSDKATEHLTAAKEEGGKRNAFVNNAWTNDAVKATILADLDRMTLAQRNRDLGLMLAHISTCCYYTEVDDITERSTSLAWIWTYLQKHYNIAPKGANFLRIASVSFSSGDNHYAFYKKFRSAFLDNLRKTGAKNDARWSDERLTADEQLSPSFEDKAVREDRKRASPHHTERGNTTPTSIKPGQIVYVKNEGDKHTLRNPFLVTSVSQDKVTGNKLLHSSLPGDRAPKFTSQLVKMDPKFLFAPPQSTVPIKKGLSFGMNINQTIRKGPFTPLQPLPPWQPTRPYQAHLEDSDNEGLPQPHHLEDWQLNIGRERVEREDSSDEEEDGDSNEEESGDSNEEEESGDSSEEGGGDDPHEEADTKNVLFSFSSFCN